MNHSIRMYVSRRVVDLKTPDLASIDIRDIAHGLSQINRFTGHTSRPYSVAQHSIMVSWFVPEHLALEGLMHDASEAYLGDVSSPLKSMLPEYQAIEALWTESIVAKYDLRGHRSFEIKEADLMALCVEMNELVAPGWSEPIAGVAAVFGRMRHHLQAELRTRNPPPSWASRFLGRFHELVASRHLAALEKARA